MKNFKVQVDNEKSAFFKELLESLDFIRYEEVDVFHEPRVYPAGNFEIRSSSYNESVKKNQPAQVSETEINKKLLNERLESIKNVISQIDKIRDRK